MTEILASALPPSGLFLADVDDPTGNNQPTAEILYRDGSGNIFSSGVYVGVHGGGPLNYRFVSGNPSPSATVGSVFELATSNTNITVSTGRVNIVTL